MEKSTMDTYYFSEIAEYHQFFGLPAPEHPLLSVVSREFTGHEAMIPCASQSVTLSTDFYSISLKKIICLKRKWASHPLNIEHTMSIDEVVRSS
jgi:hypothetical protein